MSHLLTIHRPLPDYFRGLRGPWTIRTRWTKSIFPGDPDRVPCGYSLLFRGESQRAIRALPGGGCPELARMIRECCHLNRIGAVPRPAIQCAADAPSPDRYIATHAS